MDESFRGKNRSPIIRFFSHQQAAITAVYVQYCIHQPPSHHGISSSAVPPAAVLSFVPCLLSHHLSFFPFSSTSTNNIPGDDEREGEKGVLYRKIFRGRRATTASDDGRVLALPSSTQQPAGKEEEKGSEKAAAGRRDQPAAGQEQAKKKEGCSQEASYRLQSIRSSLPYLCVVDSLACRRLAPAGGRVKED